MVKGPLPPLSLSHVAVALFVTVQSSGVPLGSGDAESVIGAGLGPASRVAKEKLGGLNEMVGMTVNILTLLLVGGGL